MFKKFHLKLFGLFKLAVGYPKTVLCVAFILPLSLSFNLHKVSSLYDVDDLIDDDFKTYSSLQILHEDFKSKNSMHLILYSVNGVSENNLYELSFWNSKWAVLSGYISRANTIYEIRTIKEDANHLGYPRLFNFLQNKITRFVPSNKALEFPLLNLNYDLNFSNLIFEYQIRNTAENLWERPFDPDIAGKIYLDFKSNIETKFDGAAVYPSGNALFQWFMKKGYERIDQLNLLILIGLLILFKLIWGSFISTFLFFFTLAYTMWLTHIFMSLMGFPIDLLSSTVFLMLMIASIEDFVYLSYFQKSRYGDWKRPFVKILVPSFYTSLTTIIGFASLMVADLDIIKRFGLIVAFASLVEWIAIFLFLSSISSLFNNCRNWTKPTKSFDFLKISISKIQIPMPKVGLLLLIFFPMALVGVNKLNIDDSPIDLFSSDHPLQETHSHLMETKGWAMSIDLLFTNFDSREVNKNILLEISSWPEVKNIEDPYKVLSFYKNNVSNPLKDLVNSEIINSALFSRYKSGQTGRAILYTDKSQISDISTLIKRIEGQCSSHCVPAGSLVSYSEFGQRVPDLLVRSLTWCLLIVVLLLTALCVHKSIPPFAVVLSAIWGPAFLISMLWVLDIKIYFVSSIFASVLVGLAGDNAIQFIFSSKGGEVTKGLRQLESSALIVGICMLIVPCIFTFAPFAPLKELGAIFTIGTFASFFGDVWILNSLKSVRLPFFHQGE